MQQSKPESINRTQMRTPTSWIRAPPLGTSMINTSPDIFKPRQQSFAKQALSYIDTYYEIASVPYVCIQFQRVAVIPSKGRNIAARKYLGTFRIVRRFLLSRSSIMQVVIATKPAAITAFTCATRGRSSLTLPTPGARRPARATIREVTSITSPPSSSDASASPSDLACAFPRIAHAMRLALRTATGPAGSSVLMFVLAR